MKFVGILFGTVFLILAGYFFWLAVLFDPSAEIKDVAASIEQQWGLEVKTGYIAFKLGWPSRIEIDGVIIRDVVNQERYLSSERFIFEIPLWRLLLRSWKLQTLQMSYPVLTLPQTGRFTPQALLLGVLRPWEGPQKEVLGEGGGDQAVSRGRAPNRAGLLDLREIRVAGGSLLWQPPAPQGLEAAQPVEIGQWDGVIRADSEQRILYLETQGVWQRSSHRRWQRSSHRRWQQSSHRRWQTPKIDFTASGVWHLEKDRLEFKAQWDQGRTEMIGTLKPLMREPVFDGTIQMRQVNLATAWFRRWLPIQDMEGRMTLRLEASMAVWPVSKIIDTLNFTGAVAIRDGFWTGRNIVQDLVKTLEPMPEVSVLFLEEMPSETAQILRVSGTQFEVMNFNLEAHGENFKLTDLVLSDENYWITGDATFNLRSGDLNSNARLVLRESVSGFLAEHVGDLAGLRNPKGRLVLPFQYSSLRGEPGALKLDLKVLDPTILEKN